MIIRTAEHHVAKPVFLSSTLLDHRKHECLLAMQCSRKVLGTNVRKNNSVHVIYLQSPFVPSLSISPSHLCILSHFSFILPNSLNIVFVYLCKDNVFSEQQQFNMRKSRTGTSK